MTNTLMANGQPKGKVKKLTRPLKSGTKKAPVDRLLRARPERGLRTMDENLLSGGLRGGRDLLKGRGGDGRLNTSRQKQENSQKRVEVLETGLRSVRGEGQEDREGGWGKKPGLICQGVGGGGGVGVGGCLVVGVGGGGGW